MKRSLELIQELVVSVRNENEDVAKFLAIYLEDVARNLSHGHHHNENDALNLKELYSRFKPKSLADFARSLFEWAYASDNYHDVSEVCGLLYASTPRTNEIAAVLEKGIFDKSKSNRLRERFFWVFNYNFKDRAIAFFQDKLEDFLVENGENEEFAADILDFMHWHMKGHAGIKNIQKFVKSFLHDHPSIVSKLHVTTVDILDLSKKSKPISKKSKQK